MAKQPWCSSSRASRRENDSHVRSDGDDSAGHRREWRSWQCDRQGACGARRAAGGVGSNVDKLESFRSGLGGDHVALPCNLSDGAAVDKLVPQAVEAFGGKLDILVNNAGVTRDNLLMRMKDDEFG